MKAFRSCPPLYWAARPTSRFQGFPHKRPETTKPVRSEWDRLIVQAWLGLILSMCCAPLPLSAAPAAPFVDHIEQCAQWTQIGVYEYSSYKTEYDSSFYRGPSQEEVEVARAQSKGQSANYIANLRSIIAEARSGRWPTLDSFSQHVHDHCIAIWHSATTPAERDAEAKRAAAQRQENMANAERIQDRIRHYTACQQYQLLARRIFTFKNNGYTYKEAARQASEAAYGPGGIAYQSSEDNADLYMQLAAAIYFAPKKYGQNNNQVIQKALDLCLAGKFLDAS